MVDDFEYLCSLLEREISDGVANPVTGEIEFASHLWQQLLKELEENPIKRPEPGTPIAQQQLLDFLQEA
jgi:hypothetical protein